MSEKEISREEHLSWCKQRAQEYVDAGDFQEAFTSFASDVSKHPKTKGIGEVIKELGMPLLMMDLLNTKHQMRAHIAGYN